MNLDIIKVLTKKDINLFFKNRFFSLITILGLISYIVIFFILPKTVDENIKLAILSERPLTRASYFLEEENVETLYFNSIDDLKKAVINKEVSFGILFSEDVKKIVVFIPADVEEEMREAYRYIAEELLYVELGYTLNIESKEVVLGEDMVGKQIPLRKRVVPVVTFLLIMTETLGLANLISEEIEGKTIFALLSTPVTVSDIFISKTLVGLITTFIPSLIFIIVTLGIGRNFPLIVFILFVGCLFTISIGFLIGSISKDFMGVIGFGGLMFVILLFPSFNVMSPGSFTSWVKSIPSHFLVDGLHRIINFDATFRDILQHIFILLSTGGILYLLGGIFLKRRIG